MAFTPQTSVSATSSKAVNGLDADTSFGHKLSRTLTAACLPGRVVCGDHENAEPPDSAQDVTVNALGVVLYEAMSPPSSDGFADGYTVGIKAKGEAWAELLSGAAPTAGASVYVYRGATAADRGKVTQDSGAADVTRLEGAKFTGLTESGRAVIDLSGGAASAGTAAVASELAATANGQGASLVGIEDAGAFTSAANVEAALAEIYQHIKTANACMPGVSLCLLREIDASGDVSNIAANGGILASDTTPIFRSGATEGFEVSWAAGNVDPVQLEIPVPQDLDDTANVTVDLLVKSGATNAATFTVNSTWDHGTQVADTATDGAQSASYHKITATIAAADIPAGATSLSIQLIPAAHATDAIDLGGMRVNYKRKLLTS